MLDFINILLTVALVIVVLAFVVVLFGLMFIFAKIVIKECNEEFKDNS
jgi:uncharacterized protein YneF (UPF0154 family)